MTMQLLTFPTMLAALALANARDTGKFMKTVPTISDSLVNLGKMEISFHFNGKNQEAPMNGHNSYNDYYSQPATEDSCPCDNFKSPPSFLSDPHEIINKILKSNDLFKNPTSSICCESSEHMRESTVVFEVNPNNLPSFPAFSAPKSPNNIQALPNIMRAPMFPSFMPLNSIGAKPKTLEIFMFPTKKNDMSFDFANFLKTRKTKEIADSKSDSQLMRDGILQPSASVKKDLNLLEKKNAGTVEAPKEDLQTDAPPVTSNMNSL